MQPTATVELDHSTMRDGDRAGLAWQFFMGYRFGIFNYATSSLGGEVTVRRFDLTAP